MSKLGLETRLSDLKPVLFLPCHLAFPEECTLIKTELGEGEGSGEAGGFQARKAYQVIKRAHSRLEPGRGPKQSE